MGKLFNITRNIAVALLLLLSVAMVLLSLPASGWKALSVQTGSMKPVIKPGDLVLVRSVPVHDLHIGDVVTYISPKNNRQTITHRITSILSVPNGPGRFVTKGDANKAPDPVVYQNQIIGTNKLTLPKLGFLFNWLRSWTGLIIVVYIPALFIVIAEIRRLTKYYKEMEPYTAVGFEPKKPTPSQAKRVAKASSLASIAAVVAAVPIAQAALMSTASLTGNTISSAIVPSLDHLVISRVTFGGSGSSDTTVNISNNSQQTATSGNATISNNGSGGSATSGNASNNSSSSINFNVSGGSGGTPPTVSLYNPTNSPVSLSGWALADNNSTRTLPTGVTIAAQASYTFNWPQAGGLDKLGDHLILRNASLATIDAISWGTDTTQLNPAIAINPSSTALNRSNPNADSDTAADWQAN